MTTQHYADQQNASQSAAKKMLVGASAGLVLVATFLLMANNSNPAWGKLWMLRPLIIVPLAGAMAGLCNHLLLVFHRSIGLHKTIAVIISIIIGLVGLWMGFILGFAGTMWN